MSESSAWSGQYHKWVQKYGYSVCFHCGARWTEKYHKQLCKAAIGKSKAGRKV